MKELNTIGRIAILHALTPVHPGTGQTAAVIDLPVAREKATGYPLVPASSLKGVLLDSYKQNGVSAAWLDKAFGTVKQAGALCFGDQKLLCLPVRSYYGAFALVTCPLILQRWRRDLEALQLGATFLTDISDPTGTQAILPPDAAKELSRNNQLFLEDVDLTVLTDANASQAVQKIAEGIALCVYPSAKEKNEREQFVRRFVVVPNNVFSFLSETATEIITRIAIGEESGTTTEGGNLWYEEAVPAEAIFCGMVLLDNRFQKEQAELLDELASEAIIQVGGNASVGRGLCRLVLTNGGRQ